MDPTKVAQMVAVLNGLTARDALCLLVGCMLTVLDEAPIDEERQQSLDGCIDLTYSITSSARASSTAGTVRPRTLRAVLGRVCGPKWRQ